LERAEVAGNYECSVMGVRFLVTTWPAIARIFALDRTKRSG
jgi:hypothetical protein